MSRVEAAGSLHECERCTSLTFSPVRRRCGRCADWPDYDPGNPTLGDLGRVAEVVFGRNGEWSAVAMALLDAIRAAGR